MPLYPSKLQLSPSVCLHLLCLLLLLFTDSSSSTDTVNTQTQRNIVQANCSTACDNGGVTENATVKASSETSPAVAAMLQPETNLNVSFIDKLNGTVPSRVPPNQSIGGNHPSTASPSNHQPVSPDPLPSPEVVTQPAAPLPLPTTGSPTETAQIGSIARIGNLTSTAGEPVRNVHTTPVMVTSATATPPTSTAKTTQVETTDETTRKPFSTTTTTTSTITPTAMTTKTTVTRANTTAPITTTTFIKKPSSPSSLPAMPQPNASITRVSPVQTTSLPTGPPTTSVASTITPTHHNELADAGTGVAVVEVAGAPLTRHLVDTASLLTILLFGLLFFLVTVAVFVTQAYESYRRKDYTQVDYLINGMYTDSGV